MDDAETSGLAVPPAAAPTEPASSGLFPSAPSAAPASTASGSPAPTGSAPASAPTSAGTYRVLARKYRPSTFADLIGQDAMVRTISNAFETGRIPQAWILTGVRGVGKTTTARILARALNYELADGSVGGPTIHMPTLGLHCAAIMESRHFDVIEMDAASHNGVDDIRQINDAIRYAPVSARYKVYILDEVHMLSTAAFNAVLKTLEEPPPHAKFVFATTEIRKVPVTVLSRCQRFDLRRLDADLLVGHLGGIATREGVTVAPEALTLIARAAEGSVRDALSLLDQAIAHAGTGSVDAAGVRAMLGLADRSRVIDLFETLMRGDIAAALTELRDQYDSGADPATVLEDLAELTHFVTRVKVVPSVADDPALSEAERTRGRALATALSMRVLSRTWQMLLKGLAEVAAASKPIAAAEMVLVRIAYVADLPTPDEVIRSLGAPGGGPSGPTGGGLSGSGASGAGASGPAGGAEGRGVPAGALTGRAMRPPPRTAAAADPRPMATAAPIATRPAAPAIPTLARFEDLIALAAARRDIQLKIVLERDVRLVRFEDGHLEIALEPDVSKAAIGDLSRRLGDLTGRRWIVVVSSAPGQPTVRSQQQARDAEVKRGVLADPLVQQVLARFPGAEVVEVRPRVTEPAAGLPPVPEPEDDPGEPPPVDDEGAFGAHGYPDDIDDDF